ncbi:hypothetical protein [Serinibacter arcticus]|uniref:hypothetical protein n=1 Tax=Serinibacter arcticus TaxID=1655435 RepID=UPI0011B222DE|nr:hypothetical protein [Serinibacter arcticus]
MTDTFRIVGLAGRGVVAATAGDAERYEPFLADLVLHADHEIDLAAAARAAAEALSWTHPSLLARAEGVAGAVRDAVDVDAVEVTLHRPEASLGVPVLDVEVSIRRPRRVVAHEGGAVAAAATPSVSATPVEAPAPVSAPVVPSAPAPVAVPTPVPVAPVPLAPVPVVELDADDDTSHPEADALEAEPAAVEPVEDRGDRAEHDAAPDFDSLVSGRGVAQHHVPGTLAGITGGALGAGALAAGATAASAAPASPVPVLAPSGATAGSSDLEPEVGSLREAAAVEPAPADELAPADEPEIEPEIDQADLGTTVRTLPPEIADELAPAPAAEPGPDPEPEPGPASDLVPPTALQAVQSRRPSVDAPLPARLVLSGRGGAAQTELAGTVRALGAAAGIEVTGVSPLARTTTRGGDLHSAVVTVRTTLGPGDLAEAITLASASRSGVEVEILTVGDLVGVHDGVELPLPGVDSSATVLVPWAQLEPQAILPGLGGGPVVVLAETAPDREQVRWLALDWYE